MGTLQIDGMEGTLWAKNVPEAVVFAHFLVALASLRCAAALLASESLCISTASARLALHVNTVAKHHFPKRFSERCSLHRITVAERELLEGPKPRANLSCWRGDTAGCHSFQSPRVSSTSLLGTTIT